MKSASHQDLSRVQSRSVEEFYSESDEDELSRRASPAHSGDGTSTHSLVPAVYPLLCLLSTVQSHGWINRWASKAKALGPQKNSALKVPVIFSHSKFINFIVQTAAQQADIVALRLSIAAAVSWSVAAHQSVSLWPAGSHWQTTG